ncbi:MAG: glycosyl hydrolase [Taibaiella sp.]|jgi:hypothetical protein
MKRIIASILLLVSLQPLYSQWPAVNKDMRPWTRWWWMGNAVDSNNIKREIRLFHEAGIGGVEIVPIYGAKGAESSFINYLSPAWIKMLDLTVDAAKEKDMGVYVSVGSGWPIGGPQVTETNAAAKLIVQQYTVSSDASFTDKVILKDEQQRKMKGNSLSALIAYGPKGEVIDITDEVNEEGNLKWKPSSGTWKLYAAFVGKTRQKVKRAAPGGEGYTLDHFSATALKDYLHKYDSAYGKNSRGIVAFYNDSYEVFNADWSPDFFDVFKKRRGYDLRYYLNLLVSDTISDKAARIKSDYRETMSDMMLHNFSLPFNAWANGKGALSLNQAHGSPGNLLDMYAAVDIAETETFGSSHFDVKGLRRDSSDIRNVDPDPNMMKFASSAAHAMGHNLVSSETFTWLTEHFKTSWSQCKPEVEQVFLAGINHVVFHGTTYSPEQVVWPGWLFYASVEFTPSNSLWPQVNVLNEYITRCQSILQSGKPDNEILVYWPVYDAWHKAKGMDIPFRVHDVDEWLYGTSFYSDIQQMQESGYAIDFVSDLMLSRAFYKDGTIGITEQGGRNKILFVPKCSKMPAATLKHIKDLAEQGATILMEALPEDVPGYSELDEHRANLKSLIRDLLPENSARPAVKTIGKGRIIFSGDINKGLELAGLQPESLVQTGLKFIRRTVQDGKYYYLVNHTAHDIDTIIRLNVHDRSVLILDPQSGTTGYAGIKNSDEQSVSIRVQIKSGASLFLKTSDKQVKGQGWRYYEPSGKQTVLNASWKLHFTHGGPVLPKEQQLNQIQLWSSLKDKTFKNFSGTGVYSKTFSIPGKKADEYMLQLSGLRESAHVWINDQDAGYIWSNPTELCVGRFLKSGKNTIRIEVVNLMANRIRYMDQQKIEWRKYHEINFVNINYKNFDAANWNVTASGIEGPVILKEMKEVF